MDFEQQGSDVTVRGEKADDSSGWFDGWDGDELKVRYRITVPRRYNTDLETAGGSIRVADLEGEVIAETTGGSITRRASRSSRKKAASYRPRQAPSPSTWPRGWASMWMRRPALGRSRATSTSSAATIRMS